MASTIASRNNVVNNSRITAAKTNINTNRNTIAWVRPADWLTLPTVTTSDEMLVGLLAVTDDSTNFLTLGLNGTSLSATIDWGDGVTQTGLATGSYSHTYDYDTLSSTVSSRGYKMAIITITVQSGTWISFNLCSASPVSVAGPSTTTTYKWLDIAYASSTLSSGIVSGNASEPKASMLEQVNVVKAVSISPILFNNTCTSLQNVIIGTITTPTANASTFFSGCSSLQTPPANLSNAFTNGANTSNMFLNCTSLNTVTDLGFSPNVAASMFQGCTSLQSMPDIDYSRMTSAFSLFQGCTALATTPAIINLSNASTIQGMFNGCTSLREAPQIYANPSDCQAVFNACSSLITAPGYSFNAAGTNFFNGCGALEEVGVLKFGGGNFFNMFVNCSSLKSIPALITGAISNCDNMFGGCSSLTEVPNLSTSTASTASGLFNGCSSLNTIPAIDTSNVTIFTSMFNGCTQLVEVPTLNTTKGITFTSMFANCVNLETVPNINTSNGTTFTTMFNGCNNLTDLPPLDTIKATGMNGMFSNCATINTSPTFNTSNATTMTSLYLGCTNLKIAPPIDVSKVITPTGMYTNCKSLNSIPAYNFANATGSILSGFAALPSVSNILMTGVKVPHSIATNKLGKIELENYFANLVGIPAGSTVLTITANPGADTANAKTSGTTAGSSIITMANTVGITANTFIYGTGVNTGIPVTFNDAANTVVYTNGAGVNGLANGDNVLFTSIVAATGLTINTRYWVVNRTGTTFQVSTTQGGAPFNITNNTTGVMTIGGATISNRVASVIANVSVTLSGVCGITNASAALTARNLNINYAVTKNWAITG